MAKDKVNEQEEFNGIDTVLTVDTTIDISELPLISLEGEVSSNQASQVAGITPLSSPFSSGSFFTPTLEELPLISLESEVSSNPASLLIEEVIPPDSLAAITPVEERTFSFDSQSLPALKAKGKAIEGLEKYEDMIKSIATLPHTTQLESLSQFSLLKYGNYDSVKVLHKLITENEIFFRSVPDDLYDKIDPVTMAYLNKSGEVNFNREKFTGSEIAKLCETPVAKNLFKSAYLARGIDLSKISIQELIEGLEIVLKHDETNLIKTVLSIATDLNPIVFKFSQGITDGYATMDGISITIGDKASTIYTSTVSSNLDTLVHEYTHNVVGFLFDDKFDHRPYHLETPISKSQEDLEKAAREDFSIKNHPSYEYLNQNYAREMIAYYVGETAGKIHQKQTGGADTGFSVTQSEHFTFWFKTHFLPVLNVYSKDGKAELSETLKDIFLKDIFDSGEESTHTYISKSSRLILDYLGFSDVEPVGDIALLEG
jgi:hypothetical protein